MDLKTLIALAAFSAAASTALHAGVVNPDCDAKKAAKSAAMKSTVGVGGRCDAGEAAKDTLGIDDDGPIEKRKDDKNGVLDRDDRKKDKGKKNK